MMGRRTVRSAVRWLVNVLPAVPELVWAALLPVSAGLGLMALHAGAAYQRRTGPAVCRGAGECTTANMGGLRALYDATLPQVLPQLMRCALYRWESNIRAAAVLGVVRAGGLGQLLAFRVGLFHMAKTATVLVAMLALPALLALVALLDGVSYKARRLMAR